jgi:hypothetical protein
VKSVNIHASCIAIKGKGVLILGESGAGKSDLALRLMDDGATLVADDRTELYLERGRLCARAPKSIAGLIEVRGLGIVAQPFARKAIIALVLRLDTQPERLPEPAFYTPPEPLRLVKKPPFLLLDGRLPSTPAKIRLALAAFTKGLQREDFNPT